MTTPMYRFCIVCSGYERRSTFWIRESWDKMAVSGKSECFAVGFEDFKKTLSRPDNDEFYQSKNIQLFPCSSTDVERFNGTLRSTVQKFIEAAGDQPVEVHIDYSCMPRGWYCNIPMLLEELMRPRDRVYFWYSPGRYPNTEYPTAGTSDFKVFSGRSTLNCIARTHFFGLGFDRIRSHAIWSVIDPSQLVCFYANPAADPAYVTRVLEDNREILASAQYCFTVPLADFAFIFSKIMSAVKQFLVSGDVVLVPDGPKPLILASSLIPLSIASNSGVVCFHVSHRTPTDFTPVDVDVQGMPLGFSFDGKGSQE